MCRAILIATFLAGGACSEAPMVDETQELRPPERMAGACSPERFPARVGNPISCCQDGNRTWHTNNGTTLAYRVAGEPCTLADGVTHDCEGMECVFGPCGVKIEWAVTAAEVHVFHPPSWPEKCGWSVRDTIACRPGTCDWPVGADRDFPEAYVDGTDYAGLTATCIYNRCLAGGIPAL